MKDIVNQILREEENMRLSLEKAQKQAADMVSRARQQAQNMIGNTASEVKAAAQKKRADEQAAFLAEKERILTETRNEAMELSAKRSRDIPQIAQQVFDQLIEIKI